MSLIQKASFFLIATSLVYLASPSSAATDTFIYRGCSQLKFLPGSPYESNLNSLLASIVNSAMFTTYNNFTTEENTLLHGLFQCRGDLSNSDCARCVTSAVSQLRTLICPDACGGALQLDGCLVKYDNATFLGVEDKTVVMQKCAPPSSDVYDSDVLTNRDAVLAYLGNGDVGGAYMPFRVSGAGNVQGVAQCVGDLSPSECQDCVSDAVGQLRASCPTGAWGDLFMAKCYARYSESGYQAPAGHDYNDDDDNNNNDLHRTLAILIGVIAAVALLVVANKLEASLEVSVSFSLINFYSSPYIALLKSAVYFSIKSTSVRVDRKGYV